MQYKKSICTLRGEKIQFPIIEAENVRAKTIFSRNGRVINSGEWHRVMESGQGHWKHDSLTQILNLYLCCVYICICLLKVNGISSPKRGIVVCISMEFIAQWSKFEEILIMLGGWKTVSWLMIIDTLNTRQYLYFKKPVYIFLLIALKLVNSY